MSRRVLTKESIDELLERGQTEHRLDPGDIVTALAKEYAQERGLRLVPASDAAPARTSTSPDVSPGTAAAVRRAVVQALGREPDGLDEAIRKALHQ